MERHSQRTLRAEPEHDVLGAAAVDPTHRQVGVLRKLRSDQPRRERLVDRHLTLVHHATIIAIKGPGVKRFSDSLWAPTTRDLTPVWSSRTSCPARNRCFPRLPDRRHQTHVEMSVLGRRLSWSYCLGVDSLVHGPTGCSLKDVNGYVVDVEWAYASWCLGRDRSTVET